MKRHIPKAALKQLNKCDYALGVVETHHINGMPVGVYMQECSAIHETMVTALSLHVRADRRSKSRTLGRLEACAKRAEAFAERVNDNLRSKGFHVK